MPYSETMEQIQSLMVLHFNQDIDIDGFIGPATEKAILSVLKTYSPKPRVESVTPQEAPQGVIADVPHHSQGASDVSGIWLGTPLTDEQIKENREAKEKGDPEPHKGPDTCRRSGCLTCALWAVLSFQDACKVDPAYFIEQNVENGCYNKNSIINQMKVCERYGFVYAWEITFAAAKQYLKRNIPVIIQIKKPHTHFLVGLGYDGERGRYAYHDPGTREGNFYENPRYIEQEAITRIDVAIPKGDKKWNG